MSEKILQQPLLYLSGFFEKNRTLYYDNLTRVRTNNDLLKWLKYFLVGVDETARKSSDTLSKILRVKAEKESLLQQSAGRRISPSLLLLNHLFVNPVIRVKQVEEVCRLSAKAANDLVSFFEEQKILKEISGQSRYRIFVFQEYVDLFE